MTSKQRDDIKTLAVRIPLTQWNEIKKQAMAGQMTIADKARMIIDKGMEKEVPKS